MSGWGWEAGEYGSNADLCESQAAWTNSAKLRPRITDRILKIMMEWSPSILHGDLYYVRIVFCLGCIVGKSVLSYAWKPF